MAKALPEEAAQAQAFRVMDESPRLVTRMTTCSSPRFFSSSERRSMSRGCFMISERIRRMALSRSVV